MRSNIVSLFLLVVLFGITSGSTFINDDCEELKKENERLKIELERMQKIAEEQRAMADAANIEAQRQAKIAAENARQAEQQAANAQRAMAEVVKAHNHAQLMFDNAVKKNKALEDSLKRVKEK